jgi:hypothetical protein
MRTVRVVRAEVTLRHGTSSPNSSRWAGPGWLSRGRGILCPAETGEACLEGEQFPSGLFRIEG